MTIYEFDPQVNLKVIIIVGLGGTGSQLARSVARMLYDRRRRNMTIPDLLFVDPDCVEEKNVGRQMFAAADVGLNKAEVLAQRFNYALGLGITSMSKPFLADWFKRDRHTYHQSAEMLVCGAVDNHNARTELAKMDCTWIDTGNHFASGQVICGNTSNAEDIRKVIGGTVQRNEKTLRLCPNAALVFPDLLKPEEKPQPQLSCADLVAIGDQHLLVNDAVAMVAAQYVFKLLNRQPITTFKTFIDIETLSMRSVPITEAELSPYLEIAQ